MNQSPLSADRDFGCPTRWMFYVLGIIVLFVALMDPARDGYFLVKNYIARPSEGSVLRVVQYALRVATKIALGAGFFGALVGIRWSRGFIRHAAWGFLLIACWDTGVIVSALGGSLTFRVDGWWYGYVQISNAAYAILFGVACILLHRPVTTVIA